MNMIQWAAFALALLEHLDYTGWGDSWEREVSEDLRDEADRLRPLIEAYAEN